jgi:hypothetical protein
MELLKGVQIPTIRRGETFGKRAVIINSFGEMLSFTTSSLYDRRNS